MNGEMRLGKEKYGDLSPREIETFLQSWLWFGVIVEFFRTGGVEVDLTDFIDRKNGVVTTAGLPRYVRRWTRALWDKRQEEIAVLRKELKESNENNVKELEIEIESLSGKKDKNVCKKDQGT